VYSGNAARAARDLVRDRHYSDECGSVVASNGATSARRDVMTHRPSPDEPEELFGLTRMTGESGQGNHQWWQPILPASTEKKKSVWARVRSSPCLVIYDATPEQEQRFLFTRSGSGALHGGLCDPARISTWPRARVLYTARSISAKEARPGLHNKSWCRRRADTARVKNGGCDRGSPSFAIMMTKTDAGA